MKTKLLFITALFFSLFFANSQSETMYIMQGGVATNQYNVNTEIDSIIFYNPVTTPPPIPNSNTYITGKIPNAKYIGRWDTSGTVDKGYWATAAMKVNFTGSTSVKIECNVTFNSKALAYSINEAPVTLLFDSDISGSGITVVELANSLDPSQEYTLTIYNGPPSPSALDDNAEIQIRNLVLDPGGSTLAPTHLKPYVLEFVGDSITAGYGNPNVVYSNYSYLIGQLLGTEVVNISQSGISLTDMTNKYFTKHLPEFDFNTSYHPDLIFVNLGTNPGSKTQDDVQNLFTALRQKHPDAYIMMMSLFRSTTDELKAEIEGAIAALGDPKMLFTSGNGVLSAPAGVDYIDFNHPNEQGNQKAAAHFAPIIANVLGITFTP